MRAREGRASAPAYVDGGVSRDSGTARFDVRKRRCYSESTIWWSRDVSVSEGDIL
jgi:hypothetical protein